ncbi:MAG TPA: excinuclease ABC subunit UvrC [Dehalococcoidia bacterium]|nr:excinuclease ABC subunit UvrC [Dehalococcoidia bacterium]
MIATKEPLLKRVSALPNKPGVYIFRNEEGRAIYVGKAAALRNRVRSYFGSPRSMEPKVRSLSSAIADFDYIVTNTAQEALHLEATLVKRHQPVFNVRLKDDKHYPYLKIDVQNAWPRVEIARRIENDGARYFGPYASAGSVRRTLDVVKRLFPWRPCAEEITGTRQRPCLDFFIGRCIAPCSGACSKDDYDEVIRQVVLFLEGRTEHVLRALRAQMEEASQDEQYERAAVLRDQIRAIENVSEAQVTAYPRPTDEDVFGLARSDGEAVAQVLFIRGTKMIGGDHFPLDGAKGESDAEVVNGFLKQFYESSTYVPRAILLPLEVPEKTEIEEWLSERRGGRVSLLTPRRGNKRRLIAMATDNAREALEVTRLKWLTDTGKTQRALEELQEELNLPALPRRIECYDISDIMGAHPVGSMVVFIDGRPRSAEYRRFRVKTVEGANDVAMMAEVLRRRFKRAAQAVEEKAAGGNEGWGALPDLLIVDGGKAQLNVALDVLREADVPFIPAAGLAKQQEELYAKDLAEPIVLPRTSQALYLVQRIRDEAHRFAVTYHRNVRQKAGTRSALDSIPGVGPKRKRALLRKFGSVREMREASVDDIAATVGFTRSLAERVKEYL